MKQAEEQLRFAAEPPPPPGHADVATTPPNGPSVSPADVLRAPLGYTVATGPMTLIQKADAREAEGRERPAEAMTYRSH